MAHQLDTTTGSAAIAYVGAMPWHGYGSVLQPGANIEEWRIQAKLDWALLSKPIYNGFAEEIPGYKAIARSDTNKVLSVVSSKYRIVQPEQVLEFFRDLTELHGYELETAGALRGGKRFWALAKTGRVAAILGEDEIRDYLLLSTSCDGTLATSAQYTSIRVVCNNTLTYATESTDGGRRVAVHHHAKFDADKVKGQLGASTEHWASFIARADLLAKTSVSTDQAFRYFMRVVEGSQQGDATKAETKKVDRLLQEWIAGVGSNMTSAHGTAWGLLNAVTYDVDHATTERTEGSRQNRAWFGDGARLKALAMQYASDLVTV